MASKRPRGFLYGWEPKPHLAQLIGQVRDILTANRAILPLTLRQIFYILVSNYGFDKSETAYQRLGETLNKARRARLIDMDDIRDDGFRELIPWFYVRHRIQVAPQYSEDHFVAAFKEAAEVFELDRQQHQPRKLFIWCEAAGMAPQLRNAAADWHVPVLSSGGFDSVTSKHRMALRLAHAGQAEILHLGDHDPSGVHMFSSLDEDLQAFLDHYGGQVTMTRLAVTPIQVDDMDLPTAPPKRTDNRSFAGQTTQCEAIPPRELRRIVQRAIQDRIDLDIYNADLTREEEIRESLVNRLADL